MERSYIPDFTADTQQLGHEGMSVHYPRIWQTLEPHIPEELLAVYRYQNPETDPHAYAELLRTYGEGQTGWQRATAISTADTMTHSLSTEDSREEALLDAQDILRRALNQAELEVLNNPTIAETFLKEALVDAPRHGNAIDIERCTQLLGFTDDDNRSLATKISLLAKLVHQRSSSGLSAEGIHEWLYSPDTRFGNQTPHAIIEQGPEALYRTLWAWTQHTHSQVAS